MKLDGSEYFTGHTTSCGCINYSIGVELKNKRFDFAVLDNDNKIILLIEFDGRQHDDINTKYYSEK